MFDQNSRYRDAETNQLKNARNNDIVVVVAVPEPPTQTLLGVHLHRQGERLDHLSMHYINDPAGFWRIAEMNNAMLPDAVTSQREILIPQKLNR